MKRNENDTLKIFILFLIQMEYVIYCRKSTDESQQKQVQSISDQIKTCMKFAKNNGLSIALKPQNFPFESEEEILKENNLDVYNKKILEESKHLFIIKESKSAKIPGKREKRSRLIQRIKKGKIKWIISYSPDRQSRNLLEGGEIINLVDQELVDLKYSNFHFEPNAAGKMMLGIWFTLSKQYSDKLSEDSKRWLSSAVQKGKHMGVDKFGYIKDVGGYHKPHPKYFAIMKQAFHMKIYEKKTDKYIIKWLMQQGFMRCRVSTKNGLRKDYEVPLKEGTHLTDVWNDPFYHWIFIYGSNEVNLLETWVNPFYIPMITSQEFEMLIEMIKDYKPAKTKKELSAEQNLIMSFPSSCIVWADGSKFSFNIPSKKRYYNKLSNLKKTKEDATIADVIESYQIYYSCTNKRSVLKGAKFRQSELESVMSKFLKMIKPSNDHFQEYRTYTETVLSKKLEANTTIRKQKQLQRNKIKWQYDNFLVANMSLVKDSDEQKVYENEKKRYLRIIENLDKEISELDRDERNYIFEMEAFIQFLLNSNCVYDNGNADQKRIITWLLIDHIIIDESMIMYFHVPEQFKVLFNIEGENQPIVRSKFEDKKTVSNGTICVSEPIVKRVSGSSPSFTTAVLGESIEDRTNVLLNFLSKCSLSYVRNVVQRYMFDFLNQEEREQKMKTISKKQRMLYSLDNS